MTLELLVLWGLAVAALTTVYYLASLIADKIEVELLRREIQRLAGVAPIDRARLDLAMRLTERK